jgi:RNA polymerase sigma-70 factor (ECF subfamily)
MIAQYRNSDDGPVTPSEHAAGAKVVLEGGLVCSIHRDVTEPLFDENYLRALASRDADAENFLIAHFTRPVQLKLRARLRSADLVQDASQETFLRVLRHFRQGKTLENPASLPGFVHSVCHNIALELLRSYTRHSQIPENAPEAEDPHSGPEALAVTEERRKMVEQVLREMPAKDRELIRRVCLNEEDKDAVCEEFGVDRNYLRVLLHRARNRFRTVMNQGDGSRGFSAGG